jgi:rod shape-determining protein MreB
MLRNLDVLLRETTGLPVMLAEDPLTAVAMGTGRTLDDLSLLKDIAIRS